MNRKRLANLVGPVLDIALVPFVLPAAVLLRFVRRIGLARLRLTRGVLVNIGLLPVRHHYYEPLVLPTDLTKGLDEERNLPGIDLNEDGQLEFLNSLTFEDELQNLANPPPTGVTYRFGNQSFESGDAEYLYQVIRRLKPARIIEIGSGHSTLLARAAVRRNSEDDAAYSCRHTCIEPYEASWLESTGVEVLRRRVEDVDRNLFRELGRNDLLFIDSSHIIRPQGDVVTEYLEILPTLAPGVVVHIHDVFTPRDYPEEWVHGSMLLWNEQYLMEGFLTDNERWAVLGAVNMLKRRHFSQLKRACPYLTRDREPGSFYIQRIR